MCEPGISVTEYKKHVGKIKPHFEFLFAVILYIIHDAQASCYKVTNTKLLKKVIKKSSLLKKEVPAEKNLMSDFHRDMGGHF